MRAALAAVVGVTTATVDLAAGLATVEGTAAVETLVAAVEATSKTAAALGGAAAPVRLRVDGMVCEGCIATVKRALMGVSGVVYAQVDLRSGGVLVSGAAPTDALVAAVAASGKFSVRAAAPAAAPLAEVRAVQLSVGDMVCNGCQEKVSRALAMVRGVRRVDVDLDERRVDVTADDHAAAADLVAAVEAAGYAPTLVSEMTHS